MYILGKTILALQLVDNIFLWDSGSGRGFNIYVRKYVCSSFVMVRFTLQNLTMYSSFNEYA